GHEADAWEALVSHLGHTAVCGTAVHAHCVAVVAALIRAQIRVAAHRRDGLDIDLIAAVDVGERLPDDHEHGLVHRRTIGEVGRIWTGAGEAGDIVHAAADNAAHRIEATVLSDDEGFVCGQLHLEHNLGGTRLTIVAAHPGRVRPLVVEITTEAGSAEGCRALDHDRIHAAVASPLHGTRRRHHAAVAVLVVTGTVCLHPVETAIVVGVFAQRQHTA